MQHPMTVELLPDNIRAITGPEAGKDRKLVAASGLLPLAPEDTVLSLYQLSFDFDPDVSSRAAETLMSLPAQLLVAATQKLTWPQPLEHLGRKFVASAEVVEAVVSSAYTDNTTIFEIARTCPRDIADVIAANQARLLAYPAIIESLYLNKHTRMSTVDRLMGFAVRNNLQLDGIPAYREIAASFQREGGGAAAAIPAESFVPETFDDIFEQAYVSGVRAEETQMGVAGEEEGGDLFGEFGGAQDAVFGEFDDAGGPAGGVFGEFDEAQGGGGGGGGVFDEFDAGLRKDRRSKEEQEREEEESLPLEYQLSHLTVSQKIRLATIGTAAHRSILVQDSNKLVAVSAIKSPTITNQEIAKYSQSRSVSEEVIRFIASNRDWTKSYLIKLSLVGNPKTPLASALHFLPHLHKSDLRGVAKNKNVPSALQAAAGNMVKRWADDK